MVEFNMWVPTGDVIEITQRDSDEFIVISKVDHYQRRPESKVFLHIKSKEEYYTYFKLKYGPSNVWAR